MVVGDEVDAVEEGQGTGRGPGVPTRQLLQQYLPKDPRVIGCPMFLSVKVLGNSFLVPVDRIVGGVETGKSLPMEQGKSMAGLGSLN